MIVVVDYGMGNLRSVSKALESLGAEVLVSSKLEDVLSAEKLVLPGVGAFGDAVKGLEELALLTAIRSHIEAGKPFLGICLGLQLLFESSEESPGIKGLSVIEGEVKRFTSTNVKIPHMGWNQVQLVNYHPCLKNVLDNTFFYFVHSYYACLKDEKTLAGDCTYGDEKPVAMIAKDNVFATQFHPEKSQGAGLQILKNFLEWQYESLSSN